MQLAPIAKTATQDGPVTPNCAGGVIDVIVRGAPLVLVTVTGCDKLVTPTVWLPKEIEDTPKVNMATPVPVCVIATGAKTEMFTVSVPELAPAVMGKNVIGKLQEGLPTGKIIEGPVPLAPKPQ